MQTITRTELRDKLFNQRGATIVSIVARTQPDMIGGKSCPLAGLEKVSHVVGMINWNYKNSVNNQRVREGGPVDENGEIEEFVPLARSWGRRLHLMLAEQKRLMPFVHHSKGMKWGPNDGDMTEDEFFQLPVEELHVEFKPEHTVEYKYFLNDKEISHEEAHKHIRPKSESSRQGTDKTILLRDYKMVNIEQMTIGGELFVIK